MTTDQRSRVTAWSPDDPRLVEKREARRLATQLCRTGRWYRKVGLREAATLRTLYRRAVRNLPDELRIGFVDDGSVETFIALLRWAEGSNLSLTPRELVASIVGPLAELVEPEHLDAAADAWVGRAVVNSVNAPPRACAVAVATALTLAAEGYAADRIGEIGPKLAHLASAEANRHGGLESVGWRRRALRWAEEADADERDVLGYRLGLAKMLFATARRRGDGELAAEALDQLIRCEEAGRILGACGVVAEARKRRAVLLARIDLDAALALFRDACEIEASSRDISLLTMVHLDVDDTDAARQAALVALAEAAYRESRLDAASASRCLAEIADADDDWDEVRRWSAAAVAEAAAHAPWAEIEQLTGHAFALAEIDGSAAADAARRALELDDTTHVLTAPWRRALETLVDDLEDDA